MTGPLSLPWRLASFAAWFTGQVLMTSWTVLADVLTPGLAHSPRVVRLPLESHADAHVALIGVLITLTPGTLTLGVVANDRGGRDLLVHSMYHQNTAEACADLADMEARMLRAFTWRLKP